MTALAWTLGTMLLLAIIVPLVIWLVGDGLDNLFPEFDDNEQPIKDRVVDKNTEA